MMMADTNLLAPTARNQTALLVSSMDCDHQILAGLFDEQNWNLFSARSLGFAASLLRQSEVAVIITERDLPGGNWKDVLEMAQLLPGPPLVIVTSLHADDYLWAEALNLGAYDVVAKPFNTKELLRVFGAAWRRHRAESTTRPLAMQVFG